MTFLYTLEFIKTLFISSFLYPLKFSPPILHLIIRQLQLLCHEEHFPIVSQWRVQAHVFSNFFIVNHVHPETIAHEKLVQPFLHLHLGSKLHLCDSGWQFTNKNAPFCS
eukprot:TRINITY_DN6420_c1_g1_i5.p2 TRINITY_DN6420_c1_g1~~TRINITY_DN6420_c1_g1_i5.p2  ORF type:complete len:109 (-),score=14.23 TRINITY_DN6420_c1_g1_i5:1174-1500(-)